MKCPNCDFVVATKKDICPRCKLDLRPFKKDNGIAITDSKSSIETLRLQEEKEQGLELPAEPTKIETKQEVKKATTSLSPREFSDNREIVRTRVISQLKKISPVKAAIIQEKVEQKPSQFSESALNELSSSIQENIAEAKSATELIPSKEFTPTPIIEPTATSSANQLQEVINYLGLDTEEALQTELAQLDQALYELAQQSNSSITEATSTSKVSTSNRSISNASPSKTSTAKSTHLDIDNSSLLEALKEYDTATGAEIGLNETEELGSEDAQPKDFIDLDSAEELIQPSPLSRLAAIGIDLVVVGFFSILLSAIFVPLPIAKMILLEANPLGFEALPYATTYLYSLLATSIIYNTAFSVAGMQTLGAKLLSLEVLSIQRLELPLWQALLRSLAITTNILTCGIGLLPALFKRPALHEILSATLLQTATSITITDLEIFKKTVYSIDED